MTQQIEDAAVYNAQVAAGGKQLYFGGLRMKGKS